MFNRDAGQSMAASQWFALLVSPLLLVSCSAPSDPHSGIGVGSANGSGRVAVSYLPCTGEKVTSVELATNPASGPGTTLWSISSGPTAADVAEFTIGESPPGWLATVPLQGLPAKTEKLGVFVVTTKRSPGGISFTLGDLKPDLIMSDDGLVDRSAFDDYRDYC
jgi:hypothetical protein